MKEYFIESVLERVNPKKLYFYHLVPKKANISKGLLAPYAMNKFGMEKELSFSLDKYRNRLVDTDAWNIYPNRDPKSLSNEEILNGINQFRKSEDGSKYIYFFRYPPYKELGKHMENILREKDIYRINLNDKELQKNILDISWGWIGSNTDNQAVNKKWYETIKPEKYFAGYNDNPKDGTPLFAPLVHIGVAFKDGICPRKCLTKIKPNSLESVREEVETVSEAKFSVNNAKDENHKQKKEISLSSLKRVDLNDSSIRKYKSKMSGLSHVRTGTMKRNGETFTYKGYLWLKDDEPVCYVNADDKGMIVSMEVSPKYRGSGLSKQLLNVATSNLKAYRLTVNKKNELAIDIYKKYGFDIEDEGSVMYTMSLKSHEPKSTVTESTKSDPNMYLTKTKLDLDCEVKNSYHTLKGETKTPIPQLILHKNGKNYRVRSEILVFKDGKVLLEKKEKETHYGTMYVVPGGGIDDPKELIEKAAARECNEEARIVVSDVRFSGMTKSALYGEKVPDWHKKTLWLDGIKYDGYWTYICTGIYSKKYTKYVKKVDSQADIANQSHWYTFDEVKDILTPKHRKLFKEYLSTHGIL